MLLLPGRALKDAVNYFAPPRMMGEADLEQHFSNPTELALPDAEKAKRAKERENRTEKAALELRYLLDEKEDKVAKQLANDEKRAAMARAHGGRSASSELTPEQQEDDDAEANPDEVVEDYQNPLRARAARAGDRAATREAARDGARPRLGAEGARRHSRLGQKLARARRRLVVRPRRRDAARAA